MPWESVVFAGGGCRCFWQAGFWSTISDELALKPSVVAAVSAGSALACAALSNKTESIVDDFVRRANSNRRNAYWGNLFTGKRVFPHEEIYREAVTSGIDQATLDTLRQGPEIRVLVAKPPFQRGVSATLLAGLAAYRLDRATRRSVHVRLPARLGFRATVATVQECSTPRELADLLIQSSCTPPVTSFAKRHGRYVVDGGIIDNAPVFLVADTSSQLVLVPSRDPRTRLPRVPGRVYVTPSRPVPLSAWDYTDGDGIRRAYELGITDGLRFAADYDRGNGYSRDYGRGR